MQIEYKNVKGESRYLKDIPAGIIFYGKVGIGPHALYLKLDGLEETFDGEKSGAILLKGERHMARMQDRWSSPNCPVKDYQEVSKLIAELA
jgi:hypothetical protein